MIQTYTVATVVWRFAGDHNPLCHDHATNLTLTRAQAVLDGHARCWREQGLAVRTEERCVVAIGPEEGYSGWIWPSGEAADEAATDTRDFAFVALDLDPAIGARAEAASQQEPPR